VALIAFNYYGDYHLFLWGFSSYFDFLYITQFLYLKTQETLFAPVFFWWAKMVLLLWVVWL